MDHARQFYIDGQWVAPLTDDTLAVINPATEEPIDDDRHGRPRRRRRRGRRGQGGVRDVLADDREERLALLDRIIDVYKAGIDELGDIISQEMGAPLWLAQRAQAGAGIGHFMTARARAGRRSSSRRRWARR